MLIVYYKCFHVSKIPFNSTLTYVILILTLRVYLKKRYLLNKKAVVEKSIPQRLCNNSTKLPPPLESRWHHIHSSFLPLATGRRRGVVALSY